MIELWPCLCMPAAGAHCNCMGLSIGCTCIPQFQNLPEVLLMQWNHLFDFSVQKHFVELFAGCSSASKAWSQPYLKWPEKPAVMEQTHMIKVRQSMGFDVAHFDLQYGEAQMIPRAHDFNSEPGFLCEAYICCKQACM